MDQRLNAWRSCCLTLSCVKEESEAECLAQLLLDIICVKDESVTECLAQLLLEIFRI
jgi:hypothetical protein